MKMENRVDQKNQYADDEIDLGEVFLVIWSKRLRIVFCIILFSAIGFLVAKSQPDIYQASALVQLEERGTGIELPVELLALGGSSGNRSATEIEILKSRTVALEAVQELQLFIEATPLRIPILSNILGNLNIPHSNAAWLEPYSWENEAIEVGLLRVPEAWVGLPLIVVKTSENTFSVELPDGTVRSGTVGNPIEDGAETFNLRIDRLVGPDRRQFSVTYNDPLEVATELAEDLGVSEVGRQSSILRLTYRHSVRENSAEILDAILGAYVRQNVQRGSAAAEKSIAFIEERLPSAEEQVNAAQTALNTYQRSVASVDLTLETEQVLSAAAALEAQLNELDLQQAQLLLEVTPNHPSYKRLEENRTILQEQLERIREQTQDLPEQQLEVFNFSRDLQVAQEIYQSLLQRRQELQVARASTIGNIRVIDSALALSEPVAPATSRIVLLSAVLGLVAAVSTIFIGKFLSRSIGSVQDIEKSGVTVLGTVAISKYSARINNKAKKLPILAVENPKDLSVESLRSLRTSLHFAMIDARSKSIAITSALPNTGKSFISVNLATVIAQSGMKVVVVDADLRRGVQRKYFNCAANSNGLTEILANDAELDAAIQKGPIDNLYYIPAGKVPPNPSELLMRGVFQDIVGKLTTEFEYVIFDTPPIGLVSDAAIISKYVGASLIVARHLVTSQSEFESAIKAMERSGEKFSGAILNAFKPEGSEGKYGYY
ncbi:polysaccharide biosynthesis tyrosine autokinase [Abyssibius alkaniclasticus]|uniref:polysaccharide biosynthesis tyrosine autokinase n=1 Tax=Abyssibius alkaniclasticus TaxID=2881234 RepID=UPI0023635887|nr:polysaccharide biosynthesis tyrosine autokinase [Abyssibius alkaniclasticus]UPH71148.1 polysaccharide biosynthesis tyrosine autokinase [Abyssibius alkaniclasticus]